MTGRWWSQPFAPEGSAYARSLARQMEGNGLDPLTVLVRETAQNTWDARGCDGAPEFRISLQRLGERSRAWSEMLLPAPHLGGGATDLAQELGPDTTLLLISDRGTSGLGGPLRADLRPSPGERPDFVQFVRNSGAPRDNPGSGGTYGFGKGILYRISCVSTIIVDTNTAATGTGRRRLMGCSVGEDRFAPNGRGLTGRHWWGEIVGDVPDPLLDVAASNCSDALGLPGFADGRTGTDIVVLAPDLDMGRDRARTRHDAAEFVASSLLWHLWPKMVPDKNGRAMRFAVDVDGNEIALPDPLSTELAPFVRALNRVRDGSAITYSRTAPPQNAGSFALDIESAVGADIAASAGGGGVVAAARPYAGESHHVARMRSPELVVDYLEAEPHPNPAFRYGAVFRASDDADAHFAEAEPATHSAWNEKKLHGTALGVVRNARHFVHRQVAEALEPRARAAGTDTTGLGRLSVRLGSLLTLTPADVDPPVSADGDEPVGQDQSPAGQPSAGEPATGTVAGIATGREPPRRGRTSGAARIVDGPRLVVSGDGELLVVARVTIPASDHERSLIADAYVVVDGTAEREPPIDAPTPRVLGWSPVEDPSMPPWTPLARGVSVRITSGDRVDWWVLASSVPDAVVSLRVRAAQGRHHAS